MDWAAVAARVVLTPEQYQQRLPAKQAQGILRCSGRELEELADSAIALEDGTFDRFDVWNIGLYSGTRNSMPELEMEVTRRLLARPGRDWVSPTAYRLLVEADCPQAADCASSRWSPPSIMGAHWEQHAVRSGHAAWSGRVRIEGAKGHVHAPEIGEIWHEMLRRYRYHVTPMELALSTEATRRRGVGGCRALSMTLVEELGNQGFQARLRHGMLIAGFSARSHCWAEVLDPDSHWKPLDVSMAILAQRFFTAEYARFCIGSTLNRLIDFGDATPVTEHVCNSTETMYIAPKVLVRHL